MQFLIANDDVEAVYTLQDNWNLQLIDFANVLDWNGKLQKIFFGWILFQNWFVLHWTLFENAANYTHHVKSVFTIQSYLKNIYIINWIEKKAQSFIEIHNAWWGVMKAQRFFNFAYRFSVGAKAHTVQ